ncbi:Tetraacyldisaccharide 4'-kinase [Macleaya cordata]|uniref:tetraacyldisaccharide 4'-kinase n=1 Tax=Macleaya cordata TaxID=56857 RepID=A0A200QBG8_MACCD|nr:Tetraacyldisaccharide 4'-kinase [Macleaya cordata]
MEKMKRLVNQIAYTPSQNLSKLSPLHRSLVPLLSFASSLYKFAIFSRHHLYLLGFFHKRRLPVPVISVGNLTWGGNGKTPMVEFIALWFANAGICPLILTRGYAGGDEARMLQRHLLNTSTKVGMGVDRAATAARFFERYGYLDPCGSMYFERLFPDRNVNLGSNGDKIGAVILDDGMQHWSLSRDLEIVMVNGVMPWGNSHLLPLGPLREPLTALKRADVAVIHHADLVSDRELKAIEFTIRQVKATLPIFFTRLAPSCFFEVKNCNSKLPLSVMHNIVVLCVSAIGSANAFVRAIEKVGPSYVDQLDFNDHYLFQMKDIEMIRERLRKLHKDFGAKAVVVVTEKDYDRDPIILKELDPYEVLVLCSQLEIVPAVGHTEESFKKLLKQLLEIKVSTR